MVENTQRNLARLLAAAGLSSEQAAEKTRLDKRTIRAILNGTHRPHARTLQRLAEGLQVSVDELFLDPSRLIYRRFDRHSNPVIEEILEEHRELFEGWGEADFDELHSRVGTGGPLLREGALAAVRDMNRKRELLDKVSLLLETSHAELLCAIIELYFEKLVVQA
jgi:transcriptional regulator with XRE-family HTH domain